MGHEVAEGLSWDDYEGFETYERAQSQKPMLRNYGL